MFKFITALFLFTASSFGAGIPYLTEPTNSRVDTYIPSATGPNQKWIPYANLTNSTTNPVILRATSGVTVQTNLPAGFDFTLNAHWLTNAADGSLTNDNPQSGSVSIGQPSGPGNALITGNNLATGGRLLSLQSNSVGVFIVDQKGDPIRIKGVVYIWPTTNGATGQVLASTSAGQLYWTNVVSPGVAGSSLWTNDLDGPIRIIRPIDQTRMVETFSIGTNNRALTAIVQDTNTADLYTQGAYLENIGTNSSSRSLYDGNGQYGAIGETFGDAGALMSGKDGVGFRGLADSGFGLQYGAQGSGIAQYNLQTNVGVAGSALSNGKTGTTNVGVYAEVYDVAQGSAVQPNMVGSVFLGDSRNLYVPLLTLGTNGGTVKWQVNADGNLKQVNGATAGYTIVGDANGVGTWQPAPTSIAFTNIIQSIATNSVGFGGSGVGPGTAKRVAMFNSTTTNVTDSSLINIATNEVDMRLTNSSYSVILSNNFYGAYTNATDWRATSLSVDPAGYTRIDQLLGSGVSPASFPRSGLRFNEAWLINGYGSSATGDGGGKVPHLVPVTGNAFDVGTSSSPVRTFNSGTGGLNGPDGLTVSSSASTGTKTVYSTTVSTIYNSSGATLYGGQRDANGLYGLSMIGGNVIGFGDAGAGFGWDTFLTRMDTNIFQFCTNNASANTPPGVKLEGSRATGADHKGGDISLSGGRGTGTGNGGVVWVETAPPSTTSSSQNTSQKRLGVAANPVTLTTNSASTVCTFTLPTSLTMVGAKFSATVEVKDSTDIASQHEEFSITALNKAGTVTATNSASSVSSFLATGSAGVTTTWTVTVSSTTVSIKCNAVTTGINATTARVYARIEIDSDGVSVVTFQ